VAIRDTLRTNATPHLQQGEVLQAVIPAQTTSQWFALVSYWIIIFKNAYRNIVVTDRRILVCRSGRFRVTPVNEVLRELPRSTRIGPPNGLWYKSENLGERLYIAKRFHKDIIAADELATAPGASGAPVPTAPTTETPAAWYPDPQVPGQQRYWDGSRWTDKTAPQ